MTEDADLVLLLAQKMRRGEVRYKSAGEVATNAPGPGKSQWVIRRDSGLTWTTAGHYTEAAARSRWDGRPNRNGKVNLALNPVGEAPRSSFLKWYGEDRCPCPGKWIEYIMRDNDGGPHHADAGQLRWNHTGGGGDIVAYRVCP